MIEALVSIKELLLLNQQFPPLILKKLWYLIICLIISYEVWGFYFLNQHKFKLIFIREPR